MSSNFGPLATRSDGGSLYRSVFDPSLFRYSWKAEGEDVQGGRAAAEYTMLHPSGGTAYFHMLLDASASTLRRVETGDKKRVWKYLLRNFEQLVESGEVLRPHDVVYVWTFNKRTQLLCRVECRGFHAKLSAIRTDYKKEFEGNNCRETHLYDAVATVMANIREEHVKHKKADFFLVPFTDGEDQGSQETSLDGMMEKLNFFKGRLHTIFMTAKMARESALYRRLQSQQSEVTLVHCETTEPDEIRRAFNTLREFIKVLLVFVHQRGDVLHVARLADYADGEQNAAERMMLALQSLPRERSILDSLSQMRGFTSFAPRH